MASQSAAPGNTLNLDSASFNAKIYFKNFIKDKSIEEVISKNNELFSEIRGLDSELQTLVYENYNKFISATDIIKNIKTNMSEIDSELQNLKQNLNQINHSYAEVDNTLKFKWKEIKKLDTLERDLNKLKYLSELPNMFKQAIQKFESKAESIAVFSEPIRYFEDYSDVLSHYKQTNFMINLYSEIKNYVVRIKTLLSKALEQECSLDEPNETDTKLIIQYLIILGEEKGHLKQFFLKLKIQTIKKRLAAIMRVSKQPEILVEVYNTLYNSEREDFSVEKLYELNEEESKQAQLRTNSLISQPFNMNTINQSLLLDDVNMSKIPEKLLLQGTGLWYAKRISAEVAPYILESIQDYRRLFLYDKESKKEIERLKDSDAKEFKKFLTDFLAPYFEEVKVVLKLDSYQTEVVAECLLALYKDVEKFQESTAGLKNFNLLDKAREIKDEALKRHVSHQILDLVQKLFRYLQQLNTLCQEEAAEMPSITEKVDATFNTILNQIAYSFLQNKVFLKYKSSFMADAYSLSNILFPGLSQLFDTFQRLILAIVQRVHMHPQTQSQQADLHPQPEIEELKSKEAEIIEQAESIKTSNGLTIIAFMNIIMKMEAFGVSNIFKVIQMMFEQERSIYHEELEVDDLPLIQDSTAKLITTLKKSFCYHFSSQINQQIRKYFHGNKWLEMVEPRNIKGEFFEISKLLLQANHNLDLLFGPYKKQTKSHNPQFGSQGLKKPELLVKTKKFNTMEMEMDKFLAKKQQLFSNNEISRYVLMVNLIHLTLKSLYENIRLYRYNVFGFQQVQTDSYYLYMVLQMVLPHEENNLVNGLFNEVMSSCMIRSLEVQNMDETVLESMAQHRLEKLTEGRNT